MQTPKGARLGHLQSVATIVSLVAIPVIVAAMSAGIQKSIRVSEARTKSMELAISILKEPPGRSEQPGLRAWAIETLEVSSDVRLSEAARRELLAKPLLAVQPVQRNIHSGTSGFFEIGKGFEMGHHTATVQSVEDDYVVLKIDRDNRTIAINDSIVVPPENCVIHLLGIGPSSEAASVANEKKQAPKPDLTYMAFTCPN